MLGKESMSQDLAQSDFEDSALCSFHPKLVKELAGFLKDFLLVQGVWKEAPRSLGLLLPVPIINMRTLDKNARIILPVAVAKECYFAGGLIQPEGG